ncbi:tRNA pseudouridine(38-40) synthase TruA [Thermococcus sp.]
MRIALKIAYDGSKFYGFQRQPDVRTVEGELLKAIRKLGVIGDPREAGFQGASRTDRGVSAFFNVVAFNTENPKLAVPRILNHQLRDVWVLGIAEVPEDFHPRFYARGKTYRYYLPDEGFDIDSMRDCGCLFIGEHNFSNFARLERGKNPVRRITNLRIMKQNDITVIEISGESFLWEMVRRIVTALKLCGLGILGMNEIREMLELKVKRKLPPAPAENLVLWKIEYENLRFEIDGYSLEKAKKEFFERYKLAAVRASLFRDFYAGLP